jgi:hypothetical protein
MTAPPWLPRLTWRAALALAFVLPQAAFVLRSRFAEDRFLSWAPHDRQIEYRIEGEVAGAGLTSAQLRVRYGAPAAGWLSHAIEDLQWTIRTREKRLPADRRGRVVLHYRINGHPWQRWSYP